MASWPVGQAGWLPNMLPSVLPWPQRCGQYPLRPGHMSAAVISMGRRHRPGRVPTDSAASGISLETVVGEGSSSNKGEMGGRT